MATNKLTGATKSGNNVGVNVDILWRAVRPLGFKALSPNSLFG